MRHSRTRLVALAATLLVGASGVGADAGASRRPTRFVVHAHNVDSKGVQPDGVSCSLAARSCSGNVTGETRWMGDFAGTSTYVLHFTPRTDGAFDYEGVEHMSVVVRRCGKGEFDMRITDGVYDPKQAVLHPGVKVQDEDHWRVVPGSGTGLLRGLDGQGKETVTENGDGTTAAALVGTVSC